MRRIGIFGGTFNPIHTGHLIIAQEVLERIKLEKVIFVPCFIPPHKKETNLISATDRFKMASLAVKSNPKFEISNCEVRRKKVSFTIDTLKFFKNKFNGKADLFFIIGSDNIKEFKKWKGINEILKLVKMVVVNRPGHPMKYLAKGFYKVLIPGIDISSSLIRKRVALRKIIDYFLPSEVLIYIKNKGLYK